MTTKMIKTVKDMKRRTWKRRKRWRTSSLIPIIFSKSTTQRILHSHQSWFEVTCECNNSVLSLTQISCEGVDKTCIHPPELCQTEILQNSLDPSWHSNHGIIENSWLLVVVTIKFYLSLKVPKITATMWPNHKLWFEHFFVSLRIGIGFWYGWMKCC